MKAIALFGGLLMLVIPASTAHANAIELASATIDGVLTSGPLEGAAVSGAFSYDVASVTGVGQEFIRLIDFDAALLGTHFTLKDIRQGGQVLFQDGMLENVTAAFFPPPPFGAPVSDIAFGFGGPGVIGYLAGSPQEFGGGVFQIAAASPTPEPPSVALIVIGLLTTVGGSMFSRMRRQRMSIVTRYSPELSLK